MKTTYTELNSHIEFLKKEIDKMLDTLAEMDFHPASRFQSCHRISILLQMICRLLPRSPPLLGFPWPARIIAGFSGGCPFGVCRDSVVNVHGEL